MKKKTTSLPILMYHYISDHKDSNAVSRDNFEDHCRTLAENGWRGISLQEAEAYFIDKESLPPKSVFMTFDDGYFDNYLYAMPILKKYGHKGTMFAISNRIESEDTPRVSLEDLFNGTAPDMPEVNFPVSVDCSGHKMRNDIFCNRGEVRAMVAGGVMQVASHSLGHSGVYKKAKYDGFKKPEYKLRNFDKQSNQSIWGMPNFANGPGLQFRAFNPSEELLSAVMKLVPQEVEAANLFFANKENTIALDSLVQSFSENMGTFERDDEFKERMWKELHDGKLLLENILEQQVRTLCWPWGRYCQEALELGKKAGFQLFLTTKEGANPPKTLLEARRFKAKNKSGKWLLSRVRIYAHPLFGDIYAKIRR